MKILRDARPLERLRAMVQNQVWLVVALTVVVVGVGVAVLSASMLGRASRGRARADFRLEAQGVAAALRNQLEQENGLLLGAGAFLKESDGAAPPAAFRAWVAAVRAFQRYPDLLTIADIRLVPLDGLAAWEAHALRQPVVAGAQYPFILTPAGRRPYYCLPRSAVTEMPTTPGLDVCRVSPLLHASIASGRTYAAPINLLPGLAMFASEMPVYAGGGLPVTPAERERRFIGWVGITARPDLLLRRVLDGRRDLRIILRRGATALSVGRAPRGASRITISLGTGSQVTVIGGHVPPLLSLHGEEGLLIGGAVICSLLLAALLYILGHGRRLALRIVEERTGELAYRATHDALTGLPNRLLLTDRLSHALARAARIDGRVAVMFIDLDGFKAINDGFGHRAGDELLQVVASRLSRVLRDCDTVGRLGGDEFVVVLDEVEFDADADRVAARVLEVLRQPIAVAPGVEVKVTASVGIAVGRDETAEELLCQADLALYAAKDGGKDRSVAFEGSMQVAAAERLTLELDLHGATERGEMRLVYQPTFDLRTGAIAGVEALVRWDHPGRGLLGPGEFIGIAEETGLIVELGAWVLDQACAQLAAWRHRGHALTVSVNISARQLDGEGLVEQVAQVLSRHGLSASDLTLEITETVLMRRPEEAAGRLDALKRLGVRIAIDDFGTGYSSLAYLRQFPLDFLKIDRAFVQEASESADAAALIRMLVQLGKTLGLATLGEGIEEPVQLERLRNERCDYGQGYLLARPLPAEEVERLLSAGSAALPQPVRS